MTEVIAHRGLHLTERENTVEAFAAAARSGVAGIELDVRRTADRTLIIHHDARLEDGRPIVKLRRDELPSYVPGFHEALDACRGPWVNIELKNDPDEPDYDSTTWLADAVMDELTERHEPQDTWLISSFWRPLIDRIAEARRRPATAFLAAHKITTDEIVALAGWGHSAIHPWDPTVDARMVKRAHAEGLKVNVWTVNDPERAAKLAAMGVDGICTDDPEAIAAAIS